MALRLCPRSGVVLTRPSIYSLVNSDRPRFRMRVTVQVRARVRVASSLSLLKSYCVPLPWRKAQCIVDKVVDPGVSGLRPVLRGCEFRLAHTVTTVLTRVPNMRPA